MGDCVPYALHVAGGVSFEDACAEMAKRGWTMDRGATTIEGWVGAKNLGIHLMHPADMSLRDMTLGQFLKACDQSATYIVVVKSHWLAVIRGKIVERPQTHKRHKVEMCYEVSDSETPILSL
ncbi:hypothetical protein YA0089_19025 [Pseudomonas viridiflava]|uniref:hypothetical protein n=1 Tax=Pseudomonas viridiflava TaxID=33069 RepID=UPI0018E5DD75|nr:hypothetical protein [Pseudomonas viridiflava]MBI6725701.1 hypothetical protein [Pseudomonas viridiflava]